MSEVNMKKIEVKVCLGTTCYVKGSANLPLLTKIIAEKYSEKVEIASSGCLGVCSTKMDDTKAPYVKVNSEIVQQATVDKVIEEIERQLSKQ